VNLTDISRQWYTISTTGQVEDNNVFFRFISIWIAFNALYNARYGGGDKDKVKQFARATESINDHLLLLNSDPEYKQAVSVLKSIGVLDISRRRREEILDERVLEQVLMCVYTARNNLFHGDKSPENPRDEAVAAVSCTIISRLMDRCFER
jgi:hypothetical protein